MRLTNLLKIVRRFAAPYRRPIAIVMVLQLIGTLLTLLLPSINADIIDRGVVLGDTDYILRQGALMLGISLISIITTIAAVYFAARTAMSFGRDLRAAVFHQVGSFSSREVALFGAPSLITRNTNDVQQIQMALMMSLTMLTMAPIMMIGGIFMALREDIGLSWLVAVAVPVLAAAIALIVTRMVPGFQRMQGRIDRVNEVMREQIGGIRVIRAFVREPHEMARFGTANRELTDVSLFVGRWMALLFPVLMLLLNVSTVAVIWFGGLRIDAGLMEIGSMTAYLSYLMQILMAVMMSTMIFMIVPRAAVSSDRIGAVLETSTSVVPPAVGSSGNGSLLEFQGVGFTYPGAEHAVLRGIDLVARPGQTVAIIGSTGAGKTSLLNLVPRLFDATEGSIKVGGVDIRDYQPEALWAKIGLVPQKAYLFSGTVASNLRYGKPDASEAEMWQALEIAQARDFVEAMPEGLDSPVAQGGTNLSGGQRQRLAIARALIRRPEIYLFDDSFSALDLVTDARLRAALRPVTRNSVVLIVAQRVGTITSADQIIVLEDGVIVGRGTDEQLRQTSPTYREIVESQRQAEAA